MPLSTVTDNTFLPFGTQEMLPQRDDALFTRDITDIFEDGIAIGTATYDDITISTNGFVTFGATGGGTFTFFDDPGTQFAILATDLDPRTLPDTGMPGIFLDLDPVRDSVIVTWNDVPRFSRDLGARATAQMEIRDNGDDAAEVIFRYGDTQTNEFVDAFVDTGFETFVLHDGIDGGFPTFAAEPGNTGVAGVWQFLLEAIDPVFDVGTGGGDALTGDLGADTLWGALGDDTLTGLTGDDVLAGGGGDDSMDGGGGNDRLVGGIGNDSATGGLGDDILNGQDGDDALAGGLGDDTYYGGTGDDALTEMADTFSSDLMFGMDGNDTVNAGAGADTVAGGAGDDVLNGGQGRDMVTGGDGDDFVFGGGGVDTVWGGDGADRFFHSGSSLQGTTTIRDFDATEGDVLVYGGTALGADDVALRLVSILRPDGDQDIAGLELVAAASGRVLFRLEGESLDTDSLDLRMPELPATLSFDLG